MQAYTHIPANYAATIEECLVNCTHSALTSRSSLMFSITILTANTLDESVERVTVTHSSQRLNTVIVLTALISSSFQESAWDLDVS